MLYKNRLILIVLFLIFSVFIKGQEMLGLVFSDYSGICGARINPANISNSKVYLDVNFISQNVSFQNNMFYFPSFPSMFQELMQTGNIDLDNGPYKYERIFNYYPNTNKKYIFSNVALTGPSAMVQIGRHAFGLTTSFNSVSSGNNIPYEMAVFLYEGIEYEELHGIEFNNYNYAFNSLAWFEAGLSYGYTFYNRYHHKFTFGITGKFLMGYGGGYMEIRNANFIIHDSKTVEFINFDSDVAYSLPIDYQNGEYSGKPAIKGLGGAMDIGLVYTHKESSVSESGENRLCAKPYEDYVFRIGISVLNLGFINFTKSTELHEFNDVSAYWEQFDTITYTGVSKTMQNWSEVFYGDPLASYKANRMRMGLPAAASIQFDYSFKKDFYVSGFWLHPLRFNLNTVWRPAQLAIIPRYDKKIMGISLPVSLFNYQEFRVGFAFRFYSFTIGSDNLIGIIGGTEFTGMDFYFSIRFNLEKGLCLSSRRGACD